MCVRGGDLCVFGVVICVCVCVGWGDLCLCVGWGDVCGVG